MGNSFKKEKPTTISQIEAPEIFNERLPALYHELKKLPPPIIRIIDSYVGIDYLSYNLPYSGLCHRLEEVAGSSSFFEAHQIKVVMIGAERTGKTSLVSRLTRNKFEEEYTPTIGVDFSVKHYEVSVQNIKVVLWDIAGDAKYQRTMNYSIILRGVSGVILVYNIYDRSTFEALPGLWQQLRPHDEYPSVLLIGHHIATDPEKKREVSLEEVIIFGRQLGEFMYVETNAKIDDVNEEGHFKKSFHMFLWNTIRDNPVLNYEKAS